jgi:hypothetical protein
MRRSGWWIVALAALVALAVVLPGGTGGAGPSALARGPDGWLAARLYLEARGGEAQLLDRPFAPEAVGPVLATAVPWSRREVAADHQSLARWVSSGGTLVIGYSGRADRFEETRLLEAFGIEAAKARRDPPWGFPAWRRWVDEEWRLEPAPGAPEGGRPLVVRARDRLPSPPRKARILYRRGETGAAAVWSLAVGEGRLVVLPADALANARLGEPGNADLLATLAGWLGDRWTFDEYHHGLVHPEVASELVPPLAFDLFGLHLFLLYLLAVLALGRRMGPAWREPPVRSGSVGAFLIGLGRLHDRLRHHAAAAGRLVARAVELEPHLDLARELRRRAETAGARELVAIAREVAAARQRIRRR